MIQYFHLQEVADRRTKVLSGGWQRKLSIAMALITEPQIIFLDEPTLGLDVLARRELWEVIRRMKEKSPSFSPRITWRKRKAFPIKWRSWWTDR